MFFSVVLIHRADLDGGSPLLVTASTHVGQARKISFSYRTSTDYQILTRPELISSYVIYVPLNIGAIRSKVYRSNRSLQKSIQGYDRSVQAITHARVLATRRDQSRTMDDDESLDITHDAAVLLHR
jgi:hypothetical protein